MFDEFILLCVILLISTGALFVFVGWFLHRFLRLNPERAKRTIGYLVCFRSNYSTFQFVNNYKDYKENCQGRVPVVAITLDGETLEIAAVTADYSLSESDIGKPIRVCYQQRFGIILLIDNERSIRNYLRLKKTLFWCFFAVGTTLIAIGVILMLLY